MRIACPFCGERSNAEFSYLGDAAPVRPERGGGGGGEEFFDYVYLRRNPAGMLREWWQHTGGCRAWLSVERNISTHEIASVTAARSRGAVRAVGESSR